MYNLQIFFQLLQKLTTFYKDILLFSSALVVLIGCFALIKRVLKVRYN